MKGHLLDWDNGLVFDPEESFNEQPDECLKRTLNNALLLAAVQLVKDDEIVIQEAKQSIAPFCSGDMDWFNWVLAVDKKLSGIISNPQQYTMSGHAEPGDLAFHPKMPNLGVRMVLRRGPTRIDLISFNQKRNYIPYSPDDIGVTPIEQIIQ